MRHRVGELQVSVITIRRAYLELALEGLIVTRQGRGSFVADVPRLATDSSRAELAQHLTAALRVGRTLGLDAAAVAECLRALDDRTPEGGAS